MLSAAEAGQLALCDVSASPHVASGIAPISAISLARLLLPQAPEPAPQQDATFWTDEAHAP
jgi:flagellar biosynthesis protein FlhF